MFKFLRFFRGSYFRILVVGRENHENLDLTKISRYMVPVTIRRKVDWSSEIYIDLAC